MRKVNVALSIAAPFRHRNWLEPLSSVMTGNSAKQRIAYLGRALDAFAATGVFAHVYAGGCFWRPYMGGTDVLAREGRKLERLV